MKVRKLDEATGDIVTRGEIWAYDQYAVKEAIQCRLKLFIGEYFRDVGEGVPWFEQTDGSQGILNKGFNMAQVESILKQRILDTDGVLKILKFSAQYSIETRRYTVQTTVYTKFGSIEVNFNGANY